MVHVKKKFYLMAIAPLLLSALFWVGTALSASTISDKSVFAQPPEPQCVCAYCNRPCGSGHASWCKYK